MREIKFSAKDITGKWRCGYYAKIDDKDFLFTGRIIYDESWDGKNEVYTTSYKKWEIDAKTLGEYTGLKDSSEGDIYEDDIFITENEKYGVVEWHRGGFIARLCESGSVEELRYAVDMGIKIIGNRYDNPELIIQE